MLTKLRDPSAFQQNVIFVLGKSMQHMWIPAPNMTFLRCNRYLEYLKPRVKLTHGVLFSRMQSLPKPGRTLVNLKLLPVPPTRFSFWQSQLALPSNLTAQTGTDAKMETGTSPHRARTKLKICPPDIVLAMDLTSPGAGTGDLMLPSLALSEKGTNKIHAITVAVVSPTKTAECTDFLHKSVVDDSSEKVENVDVGHNGSATVETLDSVKTGDLMEHDKHCKLQVRCNSCTLCVFLINLCFFC